MDTQAASCEQGYFQQTLCESLEHICETRAEQVQQSKRTWGGGSFKIAQALQKDINGFEGLYLVVHGDVEQYHEPKLFYTPKVASFIKGVLGMEPKCLTLELDSWVVGDFENYGVALQNHLLAAVQNPGEIGHCEDLIKMLNSLVNSSCLWVTLTKDEIAEHKNENQECEAHGDAKSAEWVEDEDEDEEDEDEDENEDEDKMGGDGADVTSEGAAV
ncbi:uncharacterized protein EDB91DRAFT_1083812 [Suillus paluster]|uniref:uncharacterized protein n=1 Tax=Suillus paluster TaxID=48578 RepID=UPI001B86187E|nr:uncharacterized protein EDB91DRAFT_1083812 [Suillus paluster]KAG1735065.1 hypothetical protein EDB91DRAFT_1083812 [Suillus paluster]